MKRKGFTLIELLVVIAIIGLLSTLSVVSLNSARGKARDAARKSDMNSISTAMELYNVETGGYPLTAAACASNIMSGTAVGGVMCDGQSIIAGTETILQSVPAPPETDDYLAFSDADDYCISSLLEDGTWFKCINGSCFDAADACDAAELAAL